MEKYLNATGKGEMDYDFENDILFFKVKDREYGHSLELEDIIVDIDTDGFVTGVQIFGASELFNTEKEELKHLNRWEFRINTEGKTISVQLTFEVLRKDKIIERGQNVIRESSSFLTDSEVRCEMSA